ncbi:MAG: hypothetical protein ACEQSN_16250 [Yersinia sp. (in: enterobacteria)]
MINLEYLNISHNQLIVLPQEIGNLINLKDLNISYNKLISLPQEIGNLINSFTVSPETSLGTPTAADSSTFECNATTSSISLG